MKIGLITFHRAINYGAVLQCYALQETLIKMGHKVEVIDYRQPMIEKAYKCIKWDWLAKKIIKFWKLPGYLKVIFQNIKQRKRFLDFIYSYLNINNSHLDSVIQNGYDYYVIGSDQLFNIKITNGLDKPTTKFISEMIYGIEKSNSILFSEIARTLKENIK